MGGVRLPYPEQPTQDPTHGRPKHRSTAPVAARAFRRSPCRSTGQSRIRPAVASGCTCVPTKSLPVKGPIPSQLSGRQVDARAFRRSPCRSKGLSRTSSAVAVSMHIPRRRCTSRQLNSVSCPTLSIDDARVMRYAAGCSLTSFKTTSHGTCRRSLRHGAPKHDLCRGLCSATWSCFSRAATHSSGTRSSSHPRADARSGSRSPASGAASARTASAGAGRSAPIA